MCPILDRKLDMRNQKRPIHNRKLDTHNRKRPIHNRKLDTHNRKRPILDRKLDARNRKRPILDRKLDARNRKRGRVKSPFKAFTRPLLISSHHLGLWTFTWTYFFKFGRIWADIRLISPII